VDRDEPTTRIELTSFSEAAEQSLTVRKTDISPLIPDNPYFTESIVQFLSRPYPIANFDWESSALAGQRIGSWLFPSVLFEIDAIWDKLKNFQYFRGGIRIGIRINGTKFHYGRLLVCWSPQVTRVGNYFESKDNVYSAAGFPHVVLSPTENEVHEFIMPFCVPFDYIDIGQFAANQSLFNIGGLMMYVLNPLTTAPMTQPVGITIFANFENVQIAGYSAIVYPKPVAQNLPSQQIIVPPSLPLGSVGVFSRSTPRYQAQMDMGGTGYGQSMSSNTPAAQASVSDNSSTKPSSSTIVPIDHGHHDREGRVKSASGLLSGILENASALASSMIPVPGLGSAMSVASAITGMGGRVARSLGYCNPLSLAVPERVKITYPMLANTHGVDQAVSLSITPDNKVSGGLELLGGVPEEQDIYYIASQPGLLQTVSTTSLAAGTVIMEIPVSPVTCGRGLDVVHPTLVGFVAQPFQFWRGSLKFCLQIVASAFHSVRFRIYWSPVRFNTSDPIAQSNCVSHVIDIQEETEKHFTIPFLVPVPYLAVDAFDVVGTNRSVNGYLYVSSVNPLTYINTDVPPIYLNMWMMAGEDFQLAFPYSPKYANVPPHPLVAQWGTREQMHDAKAPPLIPARGMYEENVLMGDHVTNIKELVKRPALLGTIAVPDDLPHYALVNGYGNETVPLIDASSISFYRWFKALFRFGRGSWVYQVLNYHTINQLNSSAKLQTGPSYIGPKFKEIFTTAFTSADIGDGMHIVTRADLGALEVHAPFFAGEFAYPLNDSSGAIEPTFNNVMSVAIRVQKNAVDIQTVDVFARPGDDFEFAFLVGPPSLLMTPSGVPPVVSGSWLLLDDFNHVGSTEFVYILATNGPSVMNMYGFQSQPVGGLDSSLGGSPINRVQAGPRSGEDDGFYRMSYGVDLEQNWHTGESTSFTYWDTPQVPPSTANIARYQFQITSSLAFPMAWELVARYEGAGTASGTHTFVNAGPYAVSWSVPGSIDIPSLGVFSTGMTTDNITYSLDGEIVPASFPNNMVNTSLTASPGSKAALKADVGIASVSEVYTWTAAVPVGTTVMLPTVSFYQWAYTQSAK
jgi:hypothetical protein